MTQNFNQPVGGTSDLTFIMNEAGQSLSDRFATLLHKDTRFFDCLVGYFFISGFYRIYPALENVERIRILVGLETDRKAYDLIQRAKEQGELDFQSHATSKERVAENVLRELETSPDSIDIETGVRKFVEWIRSGNRIAEDRARNRRDRVSVVQPDPGRGHTH